MSIADKLVLVAENQQKVFEAGKQAEYDAFWDEFQQGGAREDYSYAFLWWRPDCFRPKYDIATSTCLMIFREFNYHKDLAAVDLVELLENANVSLSFSGAKSWDKAFYYAKISHLGTLDMRAYTSGSQIFSGMNELVTIDKLMLNGDTTYDLDGSFSVCRKLENLTIEGTLGAQKNNRFSLNDCTKLSHDSLMSVIRALKDYAGQAPATTPSLILGSTNIAKLTNDELAIATNKGWAVT